MAQPNTEQDQTTQNDNPSAYETAADDILAVMANSEEGFNHVVYENGLPSGLMPAGHHRNMFKAIKELRARGEGLHDTAIQHISGVPILFIAQRISLYDKTREGMALQQNLKIVREEGSKEATRYLLQTAVGELGKRSYDDVRQRLFAALGAIGQEQALQRVDAVEHGPYNRVERNTKSSVILPTGLNWLDGICEGGYEPGHIWWIAGAYKSRKTTLAINMALAATQSELTRELKPAILSLEMPQERVQLSVEAMLAVAWLKKHGLYGMKYRTDTGVEVGYDWISVTGLRSLGDSYKSDRFNAQKRAAIEYAYDTYDKLPLRVYDSTEEHGGLSTYDSVERAINYDMARYGGKLFFIDYMQLVDIPGANYFDRISGVSTNLQRLAAKKGITLVVLAQRNEDSIKNGDSYSPGIKGGGDPAQTADYLLVTKYKDPMENEDDAYLSTQMKLSRHGVGGNGTKEQLAIHASSGLLLDQSWIDHIGH